MPVFRGKIVGCVFACVFVAVFSALGGIDERKVGLCRVKRLFRKAEIRRRAAKRGAPKFTFSR